MKKILSLFTALMLVVSICSAAFAKTPDEYLAGNFSEIPMNDIGLKFYIPDDMVIGEADEATGMAFCAENDDLDFAIFCIEANGADLAFMEEYYNTQAQGFTAQLNALSDYGLTYDHLFVMMDSSPNYAAIMFLGTDGFFYDFEGESKTEDGLALLGLIVGTICEAGEANQAA